MSIPGVPPPPNTKTCDKEVLALAKFLRRNESIKQRPALLGGQRWDMFRCKRGVRALLSPEYEKAQKVPNSYLPAIKDRKEALEALAKFPPSRFAINVTKLETEDALAQGMKPQSGIPVVLISPQQRVGDDEYMVWLYNPIPMKTYLYAIGLVSLGTSMALFQLWPLKARQGAYYLSLLCMVLVGTLIVLGVIRLVLFLLSLAVLPKGFWLFPNLFADVGFFQSFRPVWSWSGENTLPPKPKVKKRKSKATATSSLSSSLKGAPGTEGTTATAPNANVAKEAPNAVPPGTPGAQPMLVRQTPNGPVPVGPAQVVMTPNGPMVMTPNGPIPVGPNGKIQVPGGPGGPARPAGLNGGPVLMGPNGPVPPVVQQAMERSMVRADARLKAELQKGNLKEPVEKFKERLLKEEWVKEQQTLITAAKAMQASQSK